MLFESISTTVSSANTSFEESFSGPVSTQHFIVQQVLSKVRHQVFLVEIPTTSEKYALKVFPLDNGNPSDCFSNEIRFIGLDHPNIISLSHHDYDQEVELDNKSVRGSLLYMEHAVYGDLLKLITSSKIPFKDDEKLSRTLFRQLVDATGFLHSRGISHLDIKPENLLVGEDFHLKMCDFESAYKRGDEKIQSCGTRYYRAPELAGGKCEAPEAADIFSMAVVLFMLKSGGLLPQSEKKLYKGDNLYLLLQLDTEKFWNIHCKIQGSKGTFGEDFKRLFEHMTREKVEERATLEDIRQSKWYNGAVYEPEELKNLMRNYF
jgi:serine/threonine protein kinase